MNKKSRSQTIEAAVDQRKIVPLVQIFGFSYAVEYIIHSMMLGDGEDIPGK